MRTRAERRWQRTVKGWRRLRVDRQEHGTDRTCACFGDPNPAVWGRTFARFADTPTCCSCYACGNPRWWFNLATVAERQDRERVRADLRDLDPSC